MEYHIGTMIEIPRAALTADTIAEEAEFFSFGTNDLTQMTFGFSVMMPVSSWILTTRTRFTSLTRSQKLDQVGVGQLVKMAVEKGKSNQTEHQTWYLRRARRRSGSV